MTHFDAKEYNGVLRDRVGLEPLVCSRGDRDVEFKWTLFNILCVRCGCLEL